MYESRRPAVHVLRPDERHLLLPLQLVYALLMPPEQYPVGKNIMTGWLARLTFCTLHSLVAQVIHPIIGSAQAEHGRIWNTKTVHQLTQGLTVVESVETEY